MADSLYEKTYNPDVLSCLANLSNDEVFTPPDIANKMLDMLPQELFSDPNTKFLDPACKSGVFLREIAKRLIKGLENKIPDLQERLDHIFHEQLYGIAITEMTSLLSRRSLYCSKYPNSKYSVSKFADEQGNISFRRVEHMWRNGRCVYCGASEKEYGGRKDLESYAYQFIHREDIWKMKFDVIISNPPYQLNTGGSGVQATPIYNKFILQAKKLSPRYITMITPARWFAGGFGLDSFRNEMLHDQSIRFIHDFPEASDCFSGVQIKGGVCYFLWDRDNQGDCTIVTHRGSDESKPEIRPLLEKNCDTFIRYNEAVDVLHKIQDVDEGTKTMDTIISSQKPFGLGTRYLGAVKPFNNSITVFGNTGRSYARLDEIEKNHELIKPYKVFIPAAGSGSDTFPHPILGAPFVGDKGTACSETYIVIGPFSSKSECFNVISYIQTKLFRFLVMLRKPTQHALKKVYALVPMQDFSKPWTDAELYAKYNLTQDEIDFIESMIKPMNADGERDE